ncbi:MAG TPA: M20/M25/M40 family metallo-hydrolase [Gemmataceae bacterium]|nr:M20/M25/M40 family metallo-hydrolase [Gemmataceae bacterium]
MPDLDLGFNLDQANARLLRFLSVEGITGQEEAIGKAVIVDLREAGVPGETIRFDDAHRRIPLPTQTGNLIVRLAGTRPGPRRLFMTHLDTVPLCAGAQPERKDNRIVAAGRTALGGDNRTGVAVLVTLAATLLEKQLPHPPLTLLFTVREESGLFGARYLNPADLEGPIEGYNVDGRDASEITIGAVGAERWEVTIRGRASHAGVHPEQGISATMVGALALRDVFQNGWFGKVRKKGQEGTSNVGSFGGDDGKSAGEATNVVTDFVHIRGESRSHDSRFARKITAAYKSAFAKAAGKIPNDKGKRAKVQFQSRRDYYPFRIKKSTPVVRRAVAAAENAGLKPTLRISNGGLDANWMVRHGIPTITFGAGQNNIHAIGEYVDLVEFEAACRLALALATHPD